MSNFLQTLEHEAENLVESELPSVDGVRKVLGALVKRVEQLAGIEDTLAPEPEPGADPVTPLPVVEPPSTPTVPDAGPVLTPTPVDAPDAPAPGVDVPVTGTSDSAAILAAIQGLAADVASLKAEVDDVKADNGATS